MKLRPSQLFALSLIPVLQASAATLTWNDPSANNTWDTTATDIWASGGPWSNATPDSAIFGGTGETVTLGTTITANSLTFDVAGYTIASNTLTMAGTTPTITTNADATISSVIAGSNSLTKSGSGKLTLTGQSTFTSALNVTQGTLDLPTAFSGGNTSVKATNINLSPGTSLTCNGGAFGWHANNNATGLTINIDGASCQANGAFGVAYTLTGGSIVGPTGRRLDLGARAGFNSSITTYASSTTSVINPDPHVMLRNDSGQTSYTFTVAAGTTPSGVDLDVQKFIRQNTAASGIVKAGPGVMQLSGAANTYTGPTTINAGTLKLGATGTILGSTPVTVSSGALLDASAIATGHTVSTGKVLIAGRSSSPATDILGNLVLATGTGAIKPAGDGTVGTLTVDGNLTLNGGTITVDQAAGTSDLISLSGASRTLTLSGTNTIAPALGYLPPGTYTLISGFTSSTGNDANFSYAGNVRGATSSFAVNATDVQLTVNPGTPGAITWSGTNSGVWDINTTANWAAGGDKFFSLDDVTFADSPTTAAVTITGAVAPSSISFTNATTAYTLRGGTGSIVGSGTLTKSGAASVTTWYSANTFSGGTTIGGGTIILNSGAALTSGTYTPLGTGPITINAGTLQINPGNSTGGNYTLPNAVTLNGGTMYQDDGINRLSGLVTVTASSIIRGHYGGKDLYLDGGLAGSSALRITNTNGSYGPGAVFVGANGGYSGTITVDNSANLDGSLRIISNNALQSASVVVNTTASTQGGYVVGLTLDGAASNVTLAGLSGTSAAARVHNGDATFRTLTINNATDQTFAGGIGDGTTNGNKLHVVKNGAGTLSIAGANSYAGDTTINAGKLVIPTRNNSNGDVTVADGSTLELSSNGASLLIDNLALGSATGCNLSIVNFPASESTPVIDGFSLQKSGVTTVNVAGTFSIGTFPLITSINTPTGTGTFTLAPLPRGVVGNISDDGNTINLNITGFDNLVWKGTAGTAWDIDTTANWKLGATDPSKFLNGDNVVFDGTAAATAVVLDATVAPTSVVFNFDDPVSYSHTGTGAIAGLAGLSKSGTGTLLLATANTYSGNTSVNAGTLALGSGTALGSTISGTTVATEAILDLNGQSVGSEALNLSGSLVNSSATLSTFGGLVSVTAPCIVGGSGNLTLSAALSGTAAFEKTGVGTVAFGNANTSLTGPITVSQGTLRLNAFRSLENTNITVANTGTLIAGADNALQHYKGSLLVKSGGTLDMAAGVTSNIGSGSGSFTMEGGATLAAASPNTYWGGWGINTATKAITVAGGDPAAAIISAQRTAVSGPTLFLQVNDVTGSPASDLIVSGTLGSPASTGFGVTIDGGGTVEVNGINTNTGTTSVVSGSTLGGTGTLPGPLSVAGTVSPGVSVGTLSSGPATITGTYACEISGASADRIAVTGDLVITGSTLAITGTGTAPSYVIATYTGSLTGTFASTSGLPAGYSVSYDTANKQILVTKNGFASWASSFGLTGADALADADPDFDGVSSGVEYILGSNPSLSDKPSLPTVSTSGGNLVFTFLRVDDSETPDVTLTIEAGTTLASWPNSYEVGADNGTSDPEVTVQENGAAADTITLTVPMTPDTKKFARMKVVIATP